MPKVKMCPNCRAFIDPSHKTCEYCGSEVGARKWEPAPSSALSGLIPQDNFTTIILLVVNFGLFIATLVMTMKSSSGNVGLFAGIDMTVLRHFGAKDASLIAQGEWWRLVTAGFLHAGVFHILMNSWVLFDLGMMAEQTFGTARFLVIYFVSSFFRLHRQHVLVTLFHLRWRFSSGLRSHWRHDRAELSQRWWFRIVLCSLGGIDYRNRSDAGLPH